MMIELRMGKLGAHIQLFRGGQERMQSVNPENAF